MQNGLVKYAVNLDWSHIRFINIFSFDLKEIAIIMWSWPRKGIIIVFPMPN